MRTVTPDAARPPAASGRLTGAAVRGVLPTPPSSVLVGPLPGAQPCPPPLPVLLPDRHARADRPPPDLPRRRPWGTGGLAVQVIRDAEPLSVVTISAWRMLIGAVFLPAVVVVARQTRTLRAGAPTTGAWSSSVSPPRPTRPSHFAGVVAVGVTVSTVVSLGLAPVIVTVVESVRRRRTRTPSTCWCWPPPWSAWCSSAHRPVPAGGPHPTWGVLASIGSGTAYAHDPGGPPPRRHDRAAEPGHRQHRHRRRGAGLRSRSSPASAVRRSVTRSSASRRSTRRPHHGARTSSSTRRPADRSCSLA